jgi:hypothetical protein
VIISRLASLRRSRFWYRSGLIPVIVRKLTVEDRGAHCHALGELLDTQRPVVVRLEVCDSTSDLVASAADRGNLTQVLAKFELLCWNHNNLEC